MSSIYFLRVSAGAAIFFAATAASANPITLDQAFQRAAARPSVAMVGASSEAARAEANGAKQPLYNPELGVAAGPRLGGGETFFDFQATLSQTVELGGKRDARRTAAAARLAVTDAEGARAVLDARVETWQHYQLALIEQARVGVAREAEQLAIQIDGAMHERLKQGFGTQLEANLTTAELGRARHDRIDAERRYEASIAQLASSVGATAQERIEPDGTLALPPAVAASADALVARSLGNRPDLRAARSTVEATRAEVRSADAEAVPNVTLGVSYAYEQDPDLSTHAILGSASIALPVRTRNQGAREASRARQRRASIDAARITTEIERDVRVAHASFQKSREAVAAFDREVNERLHENLTLASESYASGKIDYFQFTVVRRELIANQLAYLEAVGEVIDSWSALMTATGGEVTP